MPRILQKFGYGRDPVDVCIKAFTEFISVGFLELPAWTQSRVDNWNFLSSLVNYWSVLIAQEII